MFAQTTYIEITGATAFRSGATTAIEAAYASQGAYSMAFSNTNDTGSSRTKNNGDYQAYKGTFPGIVGTTIIRTSWNGSVEGVRAVAQPSSANNAAYIPESLIPAVPGSGSTITGYSFATLQPQLVTLVAEMSFSDVAQSATPVPGSLSGGPVGVVVFTMLGNKTWRDDSGTGGATETARNVTAQQFRTLANQGFVPLSFFTGNAAHTNRVYLTGRNDGSGTRTSYLSETGVGASKPVKQYVVHDRSVSGQAPKILLVAGGNGGFNAQGVATPGYVSDIWGLNLDGNGGYRSSSDLLTDMQRSTASTSVWAFEDADESGTYEAGEDAQVRAAQKLYLLTWLTAADARTASSAGNALVLGYNGVTLTDLATNPGSSTNLTAADKAKVANGAYTAWNFQQLLHVTGNPAVSNVFTQIRNRLNDADPNVNLLGGSGMKLREMSVNRTVDGGNIIPGAPVF